MPPKKAKMDDNNKLSKQDIIKLKVFKRLPNDYNISYKYYYIAWLHGISYIGIGMTSYWMQLQCCYKNNENKYTSKYKNLFKYLLSIPFGWSLCGLILCGHEGGHNTFAPIKTKFGRILNKIVSFFGWTAVVNNNIIVKKHNYHHNNPNNINDYEMVMKNYNIPYIGEILHIFYLITKWNLLDLYNILNIFNIKSIYDIILKPIYLSFMLFRVSCYFGAFYYLDINDQYKLKMFYRPKIGFANIVSLSMWVNILFFLPHVNGKYNDDSSTNENNSDLFENILDNTYEFYSYKHNYLSQWLHCGSTNHAAHHCFPYIPRSLLYIPSEELKFGYPNRYKSINSIHNQCILYFTKNIQ